MNSTAAESDPIRRLPASADQVGAAAITPLTHQQFLERRISRRQHRRSAATTMVPSVRIPGLTASAAKALERDDPREFHWRTATALLNHSPGAVVNGFSAALRHGLRLPARLADPRTVSVNAPPGRTRLRRRGVVSTSHKYKEHQVVTDASTGHLLTSPCQTLLEILPELSNTEFIVAADGAVCFHQDGYFTRTPPLVSREDYRDFIGRSAGARHIRRFRDLFDRVRVGSDSAMETRLRLLLEDYGITGLHPGYTVRDGARIAFQADLALPHLRISIQYDSALHHNDPTQVTRDIDRARRTESAGWVEVRVHAADLTRQEWHDGRLLPVAVARVLDAMAARNR